MSVTTSLQEEKKREITPYITCFMVSENGNIPSLTEDGKAFLPTSVDIGDWFGEVVLCAHERVHRTPSRLERIVKGSVLVVHLGCITSKGLGLLVVGPLEIGQEFSSEYSQFS